MAMERRSSGKILNDSSSRSSDDDEKKHGLLSKLGVTRPRRLSTGGGSKIEKSVTPTGDNPSDFHYKGHRPTQEEMLAHLESFERSRTPTAAKDVAPNSAYAFHCADHHNGDDHRMRTFTALYLLRFMSLLSYELLSCVSGANVCLCCLRPTTPQRFADPSFPAGSPAPASITAKTSISSPSPLPPPPAIDLPDHQALPPPPAPPAEAPPSPVATTSSSSSTSTATSSPAAKPSPPSGPGRPKPGDRQGALKLLTLGLRE